MKFVTACLMRSIGVGGSQVRSAWPATVNSIEAPVRVTVTGIGAAAPERTWSLSRFGSASSTTRFIGPPWLRSPVASRQRAEKLAEALR